MKVLYTLPTLLFLSIQTLTAQPPSPPATPLDGGLTWLLAGGLAYGLKKLKDTKRQVN